MPNGIHTVDLWVERSETRHDRTATLRLSGFAALYPTYNMLTVGWRFGDRNQRQMRVWHLSLTKGVFQTYLTAKTW